MGHSDVIWQMNPDLLGDGKVSAQKQVFLSLFALRDIEINQSMTIIPLKAKHMVQECRIGAGLGVFPPAEVCSVSLATKTEGPGRRSVCITQIGDAIAVASVCLDPWDLLCGSPKSHHQDQNIFGIGYLFTSLDNTVDNFQHFNSVLFWWTLMSDDGPHRSRSSFFYLKFPDLHWFGGSNFNLPNFSGIVPDTWLDPLKLGNNLQDPLRRPTPKKYLREFVGS